MPARLTLNELHQFKWLIGGLLTLLSLWSLSGLDLIGAGLNVIVMGVLFLALLKPDWVSAIPGSFWSRIAVPIILVWVLIDFALGFTSLVAPLMRMVMLLLVYRTLAPRNQREDLQLLLLCLFSIIVSGAITVSLLFAVQILLFTPIAMTFLLVICLLDRGAESVDYQPDWEGFRLKRLIRRVWLATQMRALVLGGLLFVLVVALSTGCFILIPRFDLGQTIPFMQMETKSRSGFSDTVRLDSVSEITEDQSIALRIDIPGLDAIRSLPYWRILVLDEYESGEFRLSNKGSFLRNYSKLRELSGWSGNKAPPGLRNEGPWTFYFEGGVSQYLPLPASFQTMRFTKEQTVKLMPELRVVGLDATQKSTFSYQIDGPLWSVRVPASDRENEAFDQFLSARGPKNEAASTYPWTTLTLNVNRNERALLKELNARLTENTADWGVAEYSKRATTYLRTNYRYSLKPDGIRGLGDPIVSWLVNGSAGHCELYAGAFVLLAREAGYPARMIVGFVGGSWNTVEDFFVVRNSDAHAWAEIYDAEMNEWLRVDPTPGDNPVNPEAALPVDFEFETGMLAWVDSLRMQWYRQVISFDQDDQVALAASLMDGVDTFFEKLSVGFKAFFSKLKDWFSRPFGSGNLLRVGLILALCLGLYYIRRTFFIGSDLILRFLGRSHSLSPIRKRASRYMKKVRLRIRQTDPTEAHFTALQTLYAELEALRFGEKVSSKAAVTLFKKTRRILWEAALRRYRRT